MANKLLGSICLSDIPKSQIKDVQFKDGSIKKCLNISIVERKKPDQYGRTHFISCEPKKDEKIEGENYFIGSATLHEPQPSTPSFDDVSNAPIAPDNGDDSGLPF